MSSLHYTEKSLLEKILGMKTGYVSDFSDRTLKEFVLDVTGVDIFTEKYEKSGTSKANRIRTFWNEESDDSNADLIEALLKHAEFEKTQYDRDLTMSETRMFGDARKIVQRLQDESGPDVKRRATSSFSSPASRRSSSSQREETKRSLTAFLSDSRFDQRKRKIETIKSHFPVLSESELKELLSQVGAVRYQGDDSELWGIPPATTHTTPMHFAGDKVSGDKVGRDKNFLEPNKDIPLWFKWVGGIVAVLTFVWGIYTYLNPNWQTTPIISSSALVLNKSRLSTTTPNLADLFLKTNSMLDFDKENFMKDYNNGPVYATGASFENINSSGAGFIVRMTVERNAVGCAFGPEFRKELLLLKKGAGVDFYGIFTGSGLGGYGTVNPWYITDCVLLK